MRRAKTGAEAVDLVDPVVDDALRAHDERAPAKDADRLQRLAEPHVVGQDGAELRVAQEGEPVDALLLVVAQRRVQSLGQRRARDALELPEERREARELRRARRLERVAERPERQQRGGAELLVRAARRQQIGDEVPVPREPVGGQRRPPSALQRNEVEPVSPRAHDARSLGALRRGPESLVARRRRRRGRARTRRRTRRRRRPSAGAAGAP